MPDNVVGITGVAATSDVGSVTARVIANFALQHLKAGVIFRDHATELERRQLGQGFGPFFEDLRSYCSGCIMAAAASLEALINELFMAHNGGLRPLIPDFEKKFWGRQGIESKSILKKYSYALELLGLPPFDTNAPLYRDALALVGLRNSLVHYKPTWDPDRAQKLDLVKYLHGRYETSTFVDHGADFITLKSMSSSCCHWVIRTTLRFMREFDARTRLDDSKMAGFWAVQHTASQPETRQSDD